MTEERSKWISTYQIQKENWKMRWYILKKNTLSIVGLILVVFMICLAIFAPIIAPYPEDVSSVNFDQVHQPPSSDHIMGTDGVGRDVFSRVLFGARYSLQLGIFVLILASFVGVPLGLIAGYFGGITNTIIMRITDIFITIPGLVMALVVATILGPSLRNEMLAISFVWWPVYTRLMQGEVLSLKEELFVEASRSIGASRLRIIFKEIFPNVISIILVKMSLDMGWSILYGAGLSFLGLGAQPPSPEWGYMIAYGRIFFPTFWWEAMFPGLMIMITVMGFNLLGDGLRDMMEIEM